MKHYKLREGESVRKPAVKRDRIEIRVPVLLLCLALAFLVWLYIVSISKIDPTDPLETHPQTEKAAASDVIPADQTCDLALADTLGGDNALL